MTKLNDSFIRRPLFRWLAVAGATASLLVPFSASANQNDDVVQVLASAAVAYVVVDAVGGFDDKDRKHRKHQKLYRHQKVHYRHDRYRHGHWIAKPYRYHRHFRYRHDHRRYDKHGYRYDRRHAYRDRNAYGDRRAYLKGHDKRQAKGKGGHHDRKADHHGHKERYRRIAYH